MVISSLDSSPVERPPSGAQDYAWYFAYGSNLSKGRIEQRTGLLPSARTACLKGHRLAFNLHAGEAIYANIVPCSRSIVWGAAYWCSREMMDALDRYEGVAIGYYGRSRVEVETDDGERIQAETYVGGKRFVAVEGVPSTAYLEVILTGAAEHRLPEQYIRHLLACATKDAC
jgi:gamma-glutamylcyclotransferase